MKTAYELALEKMESRGIEPPREDRLTDDVRAKIAEVRSRAEAKLAELEILHRDRSKGAHDLAVRGQEEDDYVRERRRIEDDRDAQIEALKRSSS